MSGDHRDHRWSEDEPVVEIDEGMLRPEWVVVEDEALVPQSNIVSPPPERFTHELIDDEPYHLDWDVASLEPDGVLLAGTPVVIIAAGRKLCRVADATGLGVDVHRANLRLLHVD